MMNTWVNGVTDGRKSLEEILVQHKWMSAHKENLLRRFPRIQPMIHHLSSLSSKAFTIAVLEELVLLLLATAYYLADGPYALEIWAALFVAFSVHLVVHIGQGVIIIGYVPGLITSILLLPYSCYGIGCICQEMDFGKLILLGVIGFVAIAVIIPSLRQVPSSRRNQWRNRWC